MSRPRAEAAGKRGSSAGVHPWPPSLRVMPRAGKKTGSNRLRDGPFQQDAAIPAGGKLDWVISCPCQSLCCNNSNVLINSALSSVPVALVKTLFLQLTESKQALKPNNAFAGPAQNGCSCRFNLVNYNQYTSQKENLYV